MADPKQHPQGHGSDHHMGDEKKPQQNQQRPDNGHKNDHTGDEKK